MAQSIADARNVLKSTRKDLQGKLDEKTKKIMEHEISCFFGVTYLFINTNNTIEPPGIIFIIKFNFKLITTDITHLKSIIS